jgi:cobalt-zinc-cadmium efflux system protein
MAHLHHHHDNEHDHPGDLSRLRSHSRAFKWGIALNLMVVVVQAFFGVYAKSLALLADAGHNLSDVLGLGLAWGALLISQSLPTPRRTYGFRSSSILAALANAMLVLFVVGGIAWEAVRRFGHPQPVAGGVVMAVAGFGIVVNGLTAYLFMSDRKQDVNLQGAFLHMAVDAVVSLGVVVGGLLILWTHRLWIDPVLSLAIAFFVSLSTWDLLKTSLNLALDAVPAHIEPQAVRALLAGLPGVAEVHDLHIWPMSTTEVALTVHLIMPHTETHDAFLDLVNEELREHFGINHATVQIERGDAGHPCESAPHS